MSYNYILHICVHTIQINCEPPSEPPNGIAEATVVVSLYSGTPLNGHS